MEVEALAVGDEGGGDEAIDGPVPERAAARRRNDAAERV